jgi:hypothetical protein
MCVCVYVRRPAAEPTQAINPKFGVGSSLHPGSAPNQGGPQMLTPGGTPYSDPIWKTLKGKELGGGQQKKLLLRVGLPCKILFVGGSPKPGARRVHPTK